MKERIHWIDISKGFAILCVFIGHTLSTPSVLSDFVYCFHMPLFFFMSGYCFSAKRNAKDFLINKLKTIVLPIFTLGFTDSIAVALLIKIFKHEPIQWKWLFLNPIIQYREHSLLWFLASLFFALIIFYCIVKLLKDKLVPVTVVSAVLSIIAIVAIKIFGISLPWNIQASFVALMFISIGYLMKKIEISKKMNRVWIPAVAFLLCAVVGYLNTRFFSPVEMHTNVYGNPLLFYISALAGCIMVMSFSILIEKNSVLEYFGKNSLIFYALEPIQYFANFSLKILNGRYNILSSFSLSIISTFFVLVGICILSYIASQIINSYLPFLVGKKSDKTIDYR